MVFVRNVNSRDGGPALASKPSKHAVPQPSQTGAILERLNSRVQKSSSPRSLSLWQTLKIIHPHQRANTRWKMCDPFIQFLIIFVSYYELFELTGKTHFSRNTWFLFEFILILKTITDGEKLLSLIIINNIVSKRYSIRDFVSIKRSVLESRG